MFKKFLSPRAEAVYAFLRIMSGLMFMFHGVQKIFGVLTEHQPKVGSQIWVGGIIELVGGALIAVGLFTRCAAFIASGTMAVAYTQFHWAFAGGAKLLPGVNGGEPALLFSILFLYIACKGAGVASIDGPNK